jgi:hypothetical protein
LRVSLTASSRGFFSEGREIEIGITGIYSEEGATPSFLANSHFLLAIFLS